METITMQEICKLKKELQKTKQNLKKEWTDQETEKVEKSIREWLSNLTFSARTRRGINSTECFLPPLKTEEQMNNLLGLAYTSSSEYAGLWVCNVELIVKYDGERYFVQGFAMDTNNIYAVCHDEKENDYYIIIN